ncbi:MAG: thermostable hemolysin [Pseudomonadota bacterium]|nr:thermostable hemolysin [Pseudomonadota bacterium]
MTRISNRSHAFPTGASLVGPRHPQRPRLEQFIGQVFERHYQARVRRCMPSLLGLCANDGHLLAALGLRPAASDRLFLEHYLPQPVEQVLDQRLASFDLQVPREKIMEVGNLAAAHTGGGRWLIIALTAYLQGAGYDWVVFTALPALRNSFGKLGLHMLPLGEARREQLPLEQQADWGSYYDGKPQVMAVNVHHTFGVLDRYLRLEQAAHMLDRLWQTAYQLGSDNLVAPGAVRA